MFTIIKRVSCFENRIDTSMEKFMFHHKFLGLFLIFVGMPVVTPVAVCACTTMITLPLAFMLGWI